MTKTTAPTEPGQLADTTPGSNDPKIGRATLGVSLPRLYLLRFGYLLIAVGLALTKWPLILDHLIFNPGVPWPLMDGVVTCMLVALSLLSLLGLRYPLQMLPILLFELAWKFIWVGVVVLPLWTADQLDPETVEVFCSCLVVLIVLAVIPWRYVVAEYAKKPGDRWRSVATRPVSDEL